MNSLLPVAVGPVQTSTTKQPILIVQLQSPGDSVVMTGAIECLARSAWGKDYLIGVECNCNAAFENNPHIQLFRGSNGFYPPGTRTIKLENNHAINLCNQRPYHFLHGLVQDLATQLQIPLELTVNRPFLYAGKMEREFISQPAEVGLRKYAVLNAGYKHDYTVKKWRQEYWQEVIDYWHRRGLQFVQVGDAKAKDHTHPNLKNVLDLRGKTDHRQLIRLVYHSQFAIGGVTFLQAIAAGWQKPYICLQSGMEPISWQHYPTQITLTKLGSLSCCRLGSCWKSRVVKRGDGDEKDNSLCVLPVLTDPDPTALCMHLITPEQVNQAIQSLYDGGIL